MPRDAEVQRVRLGVRDQDQRPWIGAGNTGELCWCPAPVGEIMVGKRTEDQGPEQGQVWMVSTPAEKYAM